MSDRAKDLLPYLILNTCYLAVAIIGLVIGWPKKSIILGGGTFLIISTLGRFLGPILHDYVTRGDPDGDQ